MILIPLVAIHPQEHRSEFYTGGVGPSVVAGNRIVFNYGDSDDSTGSQSPGGRGSVQLDSPSAGSGEAGSVDLVDSSRDRLVVSTQTDGINTGDTGLNNLISSEQPRNGIMDRFNQFLGGLFGSRGYYSPRSEENRDLALYD